MNLSETTRAYIYRILLAVAAVAVGYGVLSGEEATLWVSVGAAILGNGLATFNTSTQHGEGDTDGYV